MNKSNGKLKLSVIILAYTIDENSLVLTKNCITSLRDSVQANTFLEIVIVESGKLDIASYTLSETDVLIPYGNEEFNFHNALNIGLQKATGNYVAFCNNDLLFYKNWSENLVKQMMQQNAQVGSPVDPRNNKLWMYDLKGLEYKEGYEIQKFFKGWCFIVQREAFTILNNFDERFKFYYADNDFIRTVYIKGLKHITVLDSLVHHLEKNKNISIEKNFDKLLKKEYLRSIKIPPYIIKEQRYWVLQNSKMVEGLVAYHGKWGSYRVMKLKTKMVCILRYLKFNRILRIV